MNFLLIAHEYGKLCFTWRTVFLSLSLSLSLTKISIYFDLFNFLLFFLLFCHYYYFLLLFSRLLSTAASHSIEWAPSSTSLRSILSLDSCLDNSGAPEPRWGGATGGCETDEVSAGTIVKAWIPKCLVSCRMMQTAKYKNWIADNTNKVIANGLAMPWECAIASTTPIKAVIKRGTRMPWKCWVGSLHTLLTMRREVR